MKLRLTLLTYCLFCVGIFSHAQTAKKKPAKPKVEDGATPLPVIVYSSKKDHGKPPPPPPPKVETVRFAPPKIVKDPPPPKDINGKPLPPPKVEVVHFPAPKAVKDAPPPPKPPRIISSVKPEKMPAA